MWMSQLRCNSGPRCGGPANAQSLVQQYGDLRRGESTEVKGIYTGGAQSRIAAGKTELSPLCGARSESHARTAQAGLDEIVWGKLLTRTQLASHCASVIGRGLSRPTMMPTADQCFFLEFHDRHNSKRTRSSRAGAAVR